MTDLKEARTIELKRLNEQIAFHAALTDRAWCDYIAKQRLLERLRRERDEFEAGGQP